jgi:prophage antirepressor-like protein
MDIVEIFKSKTKTQNITIKGTFEDPLFRASDIGNILEIKNIRASISDFDASEKVVESIYTHGGDQCVNFLTEKGLYKLLYRSRVPIALEFQSWVASILREKRLQTKHALQQQLEQKAKEIEEKDNELKKFKKKVLKRYEKQDRVYVIEDTTCQGNKVYKIGFSTNFNERVGTYETSHFENKLIYEKTCVNGRLLESVLHHCLRHVQDSIRKEWFHTDSKTVIETIRVVQYIVDNLHLHTDLLSFLKSVGDMFINDNTESLDQETIETNDDIQINDNKYEQFLSDCFLKDENSLCNYYEASCRYRLWNKGLTNEQYNQFSSYMRNNFKTEVIWDDKNKVSHHAYKGLKMLDIMHQTNASHEVFDKFVDEACVVSCIARVPLMKLTTEYMKWKQSKNIELGDVQKEYLAVKKIVSKQYIRVNGTFIYDNKRESNGIFGITLKINNLYDGYYIPTSSKVRKQVYKIDPSTNEVVETYTSLTEVSKKLQNDMYYKVKNAVLHNGFLFSYEQPELEIHQRSLGA